MGAKKNRLISKSIYAFDLDKRLLQTMDADMFIPSKDIVCEEGFTIKTINPHITIERTYIQMIAYPYTSITEALKVKKAPISKKIACVTVEDGKVILNIKKPLKIKANTTILFRLDYKAPLRGKNPELFFCGSIQPSDYLNLRKLLDIKEISKEIILQPHSRRQFRAWVFNASKPIAFPTSQVSSFEGVQCISRDFKLDIKLTANNANSADR